MSVPLYRFKRLDRAALMAELGSSRLTSLVSYVGSNTVSVISTTPTQTNLQTCFSDVYASAIGAGYTSQQAAQIAGVAIEAYSAAITAGSSTSMAAQAATAAAIAKVGVIAAYELLSGDPGAMLEAAEFAAFLGSALGGVPTASQQAVAQNVINAFAASLGLSL